MVAWSSPLCAVLIVMVDALELAGYSAECSRSRLSGHRNTMRRTRAAVFRGCANSRSFEFHRYAGRHHMAKKRAVKKSRKKTPARKGAPKKQAKKQAKKQPKKQAKKRMASKAPARSAPRARKRTVKARKTARQTSAPSSAPASSGPAAWAPVASGSAAPETSSSFGRPEDESPDLDLERPT
jgi:hypothetical protein